MQSNAVAVSSVFILLPPSFLFCQSDCCSARVRQPREPAQLDLGLLYQRLLYQRLLYLRLLSAWFSPGARERICPGELLELLTGEVAKAPGPLCPPLLGPRLSFQSSASVGCMPRFCRLKDREECASDLRQQPWRRRINSQLLYLSRRSRAEGGSTVPYSITSSSCVPSTSTLPSALRSRPSAMCSQSAFRFPR